MKKIISMLFLFLLIGCSSVDEPDQAINSSLSKEEAEANQDVSNTSAEEVESISILKDAELGIIPDTLTIPSINVETEVEKVGRLDNGEMDVPGDFTKTGWFEPGTMPGNRGSSVIAGHVDDKTGPAVFFDLKKLEKGDEVIVKNDKGEELIFEVVAKEIFPMDNAPVADIFGYTSRRMLNLITCTGPFDRSKGGHIDRLVVYTELKQ